MSTHPQITPDTEGGWNVSTWTVTLTVRGSSQRLRPACLDQLGFLEPTIAGAALPNRRTVRLVIKATSAAAAADYGRRRTAQALATSDPGWRVAGPAHALQLDARPNEAHGVEPTSNNPDDANGGVRRALQDMSQADH